MESLLLTPIGLAMITGASLFALALLINQLIFGIGL